MMTELLYVQVPLEEGQLMNFVGVHPVRWHTHPEHPTAGFRPVTEEEIVRLIKFARDHPEEPVEYLVESVFGDAEEEV